MNDNFCNPPKYPLNELVTVTCDWYAEHPIEEWLEDVEKLGNEVLWFSVIGGSSIDIALIHIVGQLPPFPDDSYRTGTRDEEDEYIRRIFPEYIREEEIKI